MPGSLPTALDVRAFVYDCYRRLDAHAEVEQYVTLLADSDLDLVFPEATLNDADAFAAWYSGRPEKFNLPGVTTIFFDEVHELKRVDVFLSGSDSTSSLSARLARAKT